MNQKVKTELDKIVSTLAETGIVTKIILFGSYPCPSHASGLRA